MEDEHICIDNLLEHLGATAHFPSPGAFYGVCNLVAFTILWNCLVYISGTLIILIKKAKIGCW